MGLIHKLPLLGQAGIQTSGPLGPGQIRVAEHLSVPEIIHKQN